MFHYVRSMDYAMIKLEMFMEDEELMPVRNRKRKILLRPSTEMKEKGLSKQALLVCTIITYFIEIRANAKSCPLWLSG